MPGAGKGGRVKGPGGPREDMVPAKLSNGEFVMTARAVRGLGGGSRARGFRRMRRLMKKLERRK